MTTAAAVTEGTGASPRPVPLRWIPGPDAGRRLSVIGSIAVLIAAIHLSYRFLVAPTYAYMKLTYTTPDAGVYAILIGLLLLVAAIMPVRLGRPADFLLWVVYLLVVIPSLTVSYYARTLKDADQIALGCAIAAAFTLVIVAGRLPTGWLTTRIRPLSPALFWVVIGGFSAVTYAMLAATGHLTLSLPGLANVYDARSDFSETLTGNRLLAYLMPTQATVINPVLIVAGIRKRNLLLAGGGVLAELMLYGAAGNKSILFSIPAILIIAVLFAGGRRPAGAFFSWAMGLGIAAAAVIDELANTVWLTSLFTRRMVDVPGLLSGAWVSTFVDRPKAAFAHSFLSPFLHYSYEVTPPFVVADKYFQTPTMNANANLFADGFANAGWVGIFIEALVLAAIVATANAAGRRMPLAAAAMILAAPSVSLVNGSVFTSLLSHGVAPALLVMLFAPASVWLPGKLRTARLVTLEKYATPRSA